MTREERAEISRRNGRRSKGPKNPVRGALRDRNPGAYAAAFWSKVERSDATECWEWKGALFRRKDENGKSYGMVKAAGKTLKAHREAYRLTHGSIPIGGNILHSCGNPSCVNPAHLRCGTLAENAQDTVRHGRAGRNRGVNRYNAKLNPAMVREIRRESDRGVAVSALAARYGVNTGTISRICRRLRWKHVQ